MDSCEHKVSLCVLTDCPDGYTSHHESCYKLLPVQATWAEAQSDCPKGFTANDEWCYVLLHTNGSWGESALYCNAIGGKLATVENAQEQQFLVGYLGRLQATIKSAQVWIGGTDLLEEGTFVEPETLEPLSYFNWAPNEPDNLLGQHCLSMFNNPSFTWDDEHCDKKHYALCKRPKTGDAVVVG